MNRSLVSNLRQNVSRGLSSLKNNLPQFGRNVLSTVDNVSKGLNQARDTANRVYNVAKSNNLIKPNEKLDRGINSVNQVVDNVSNVNKNLQKAGAELF